MFTNRFFFLFSLNNTDIFDPPFTICRARHFHPFPYNLWVTLAQVVLAWVTRVTTLTLLAPAITSWPLETSTHCPQLTTGESGTGGALRVGVRITD